MKIPEQVLYFPAVIDFKNNQAYFPHVKAENYLGDKVPISIQFVRGTNVYKISQLLGLKLSKLIAIDMCNNHTPEPKSDLNLKSIQLTSYQKTIMIPVNIRDTLFKILNKPIRKTVTIPLKLNRVANKYRWNFSRLLSNAIRARISQLRSDNHAEK